MNAGCHAPGYMIVPPFPMTPPSAISYIATHNRKKNSSSPSNSAEYPWAAGETKKTDNVADHDNFECLRCGCPSFLWRMRALPDNIGGRSLFHRNPTSVSDGHIFLGRPHMKFALIDLCSDAMHSNQFFSQRGRGLSEKLSSILHQSDR